MLTIILNSGMGTRMEELTETKPKCLLDLNNRDTILSRQMYLLNKYGLRDIVITTGPFNDQIVDYLQLNFPEMNFEFVHNPLYASTNYIYTLNCIDTALIKDDVFLMHGDLVFEEKILHKMLVSNGVNNVLIDKKSEVPVKDFKGRFNDNKIVEIGVEVFGPNSYTLMPFYKFREDDFLLWLKEIEKFVKQGKDNVYAENALNKLLSEQIDLFPVEFSNNFCMEIDNKNDLENAKESIAIIEKEDVKA